MLGFTQAGTRARQRPMGRLPPGFSAHLILIVWQTHDSVFGQPPATPHQRPQGRLGILWQQRQERRARAAYQKLALPPPVDILSCFSYCFFLISLLAFVRNYMDVVSPYKVPKRAKNSETLCQPTTSAYLNSPPSWIPQVSGLRAFILALDIDPGVFLAVVLVFHCCRRGVSFSSACSLGASFLLLDSGWFLAWSSFLAIVWRWHC